MPSVRDDPDMTDAPERTRRVVSMLSRIRGREDDDIPTEPGICFMGGFLPGTATAQETVSASFLLHDKHDVGFRVETDSDIHESDTLIQRTDMNEAINAADGRTIRKGQIQLQGIQQAEEWLSDGLTGAKVRGHYFALEANSKIGSAATPMVSLDMNNGGRLPGIDGDRHLTQASLTEGEVVALWDAVSRSLRPRPNGF
jgi:Tle cognate immunity protein 4 C-terminal domain